MLLDIPLFNNTALWIQLLIPLTIWAWFIADINGADEDEFSKDLPERVRRLGGK